jgi:uncharacterized protein (DUF2252 family)
MTPSRSEPNEKGAPAKATHPSVAERTETGRATRKATPRSALGGYEPASDRPDPIDLLRSQEKDRVQGLLPIRYGRMLASPFAFYRGAALIMASDLSHGGRTTLDAQLCGDAHVANFGAYGSPERRLVFDVNDFDETHPGPFEWDVKRLVTSVLLACRGNGFSHKTSTRLALGTAQAYRAAMVQLSGMPNLSAWNTHIDVDDLASALARSGAHKVARSLREASVRAHSRDSVQAFSKLTTIVDGRARIVSQPPLIVPVGQLVGDEDPEQLMHRMRVWFRDYRESLQQDRRHLLKGFQLVDLAHKVVGVGSVGTRCWIVLLTGRDGSDPLFLQIKQAGSSVLEPYTARSRYSSAGERVVQGQRLLQAASDIFLGWTQDVGVDPNEYYVRQLRDWKLSANLATLSPKSMRLYVGACAAALAHAHARSGDRIAIAAYLGSADPAEGANAFDRAMVSFAHGYIGQNQRDYEALRRAVADGRVQASA